MLRQAAASGCCSARDSGILDTLTADAQHKPEAAESHSPGSSGSKNKITSDLQMSLDEAHLILNVKKDAKLEDIVAVSVECRLIHNANN